MFPGPYDIRAYAYEAQCTYTNRTPVGAYRGVWGPIATLAQEGMIEAIARELAIPAVEVRRRNLIPEAAMPYTSITGQTYESGSYRESLELAVRQIDLEGLAARRAEAERRGKRRGIGLALFVEPTAFAGYESARVEVMPSGGVVVTVGTAPSGQGHETAFAQLAAGVLGVPIDQVEVRLGDSAQAPYGGGTGGSRSLVLGGGAVAEAAEDVARKVRRIAGKLLEAAPDDVVLEDGAAHVAGVPARSVSLAQVARVAYQRIRDLPEGESPGLESTQRHRPGATTTFANGCHAAEVEVDPETGRVNVLRYVAVEDCGVQLNPTLVEGQIHGGVAQGVGSTFLEHLAYGEDGQPLATTFMDYLLPTSTEVPPMAVLKIETPSPHTAFGMKGVGEAALIAAPACLSLAVADALGAPVSRLPLTPDAVWRALSPDRGTAATAATP
jgi:carbon-monoxide dehydrogenase large subunit